MKLIFSGIAVAIAEKIAEIWSEKTLIYYKFINFKQLLYVQIYLSIRDRRVTYY